MGGFAWVTLATNDSYSLGALVLAHSLRRVNTAHQLVVLVTPGVTEAMKTQLSAVFNVVKLVDVLDSRDADNLALLARPELGITFTKLHCWRLTQFDKCVFLDADTLVLQNSDELFEREELSAAPDAGWPDCFNSGVFVYKPSDETYKALIEFALIHGSFDGGDQGLLNLFFSDWPTKDIKKHLPFVYNMCSTATYSYLPAFKQFGQGLKIIHFIGTAKPWLQPFNTETGLATVSGSSQTITQFVQLWWDLFCTSVHPSLSTEMTRHRLSSSYVFLNSTNLISSEPTYPDVSKTNYYMPRPPTPPLPSYVEPLFHEEESYAYFDPWDEVFEDRVRSEPDDHYNHVESNGQNESGFVAGSEHHYFSDGQFTEHNNEHREFCETPHHSTRPDPFHHSELSVRHHSNHSNHEVREAFSSSNVSVSGGGGGQDIAVWNRLSRQESFSQPEHSVSAPELRLVEPVTLGPPPLHTHSHETQGSPHTLLSSVDSHPQQHSPSPAQSDAGLAGALATITLGAPLSAEQTALEEHLRRQGWEQGNIDYMGKDSFANIWKKICDTLGSSPQPLPVEETPAPVAPVAAPVYVSSVEISPAGPIDTSPPASYAPVSAPKPTVVASDTEAASKAAAPEAVTVVPEPKSPSVTELVSSEPTVTPTSLDSSAQPSTLVPVVSSNTPAATAPPPEPSASALESATKTETASFPVEPEPSVKTEIPPVTWAPLTPVVPEVPTVPLSETSAPSLPASQDQTLSPTSVSETPVIQTATITSAPSLTSPPTSVQVPLPSEPATPPPVAVDTPSVIQPSVLSPSVASSQSEKDPEVPLQAYPPVAQIIATPPTESSTTTSPVEVKAPISQTTPDILTTTSSDAPTAKAAPISEEVAATVTENTSEISSTKPSEPSVEIPKKTPDEKLAEPLTQLPPATEPTLTPVDTATPQQETVLSSDSIPVQPDTPTVTEPTPPTSPPTAPVESPLATKLKVDTELPETPPVGSSSAQPSLVAVTDEPPVPPKRKGGAKANQDGKNQKGGKQSKGKK